MKKLIFSSLFMLLGLTSVSAQTALQNEILEVANRTNNYFMTKYSDPTIDTFVKKKRTSNLWTRAVYYEGLMALYEIDPQQRYLDYTDKWADYHKWTARGSVNDTDADSSRCVRQTCTRVSDRCRYFGVPSAYQVKIHLCRWPCQLY